MNEYKVSNLLQKINGTVSLSNKYNLTGYKTQDNRKKSNDKGNKSKDRSTLVYKDYAILRQQARSKVGGSYVLNYMMKKTLEKDLQRSGSKIMRYIRKRT